MTVIEDNEKCNELKGLAFLIFDHDTGWSSYFHINDTDIRLHYNIELDKIHWYRVRKQYEKLTFEEVLDLVSDEIKIELLFNLDLFR